MDAPFDCLRGAFFVFSQYVCTLSTPAKSSSSSSSAAGDAATPGRSVGLFASLQNWLTPGKTPRVKKRYTPAASSSAAVAAACVVQGVVLGSAVDASGKRKRRRNPLSEVQAGDAKVPTPVEMKVMNIFDSPPANPLMSCGGGEAQIMRSAVAASLDDGGGGTL